MWAVVAGAVIGAGASIYASSQASDAAADATAANSESSAAAIAEQRRQFNLQQDNMRPWLTAGTGAVGMLANRLGMDTIDSGYTALTDAEASRYNADQVYQRILSGEITPTADYLKDVNNGEDPIARLARDSRMLNQLSPTGAPKLYRGPNGEITSTPPRTAGLSENDPRSFLNTPTFQFDQSKVAVDPGYDFRLKQGVNAVTAAGAAAGNLGSGNLGVALQNYGQELGSQEYGAAYQRAYGEQMDRYNSGLNAQNTLFNRLSGVAGTGQVAASQLGAAGSSMANNIGNIGMQTAAANGAIGMNNAATQGNIVGNLVQTGVNAYGAYNQNQLYQNYLNGGNGALYNDAGGNINNVDFGPGWE